jgi:hypothetical protein
VEKVLSTVIQRIRSKSKCGRLTKFGRLAPHSHFLASTYTIVEINIPYEIQTTYVLRYPLSLSPLLTLPCNHDEALPPLHSGARHSGRR